MPEKTLIVITGPTAIGKTAISIRIAKEFNSVILSADSRQFFRELSIGTAKPSEQELASAKHYFINSHSIEEKLSVGDFEEQALSLLESVFKTDDVAVLVGGSGLYINVICKGFDALPKAGAGIREELNREYLENGISVLQAELKDADPQYFEEVDRNNPQRLIRALEVCRTTGEPFSSFRTKNNKVRPFKMIKIGLNTARNTLYHKINQRVDLMIKDGLINEVKSLQSYRHLNALNTVGYKEIFEFIDGNISLEDAIENIKQNTRRFAKRQLTWFNKDTQITWFEPTQYDQILKYLQQSIDQS